MAEGISLLDLPQINVAAVEDGQFTYLVTPEGDPYKVAIEDLVGGVNTVNGCICVKQAKLTVPTAQVLTGNTTPVSFGITVGAGYYARVLSADVFIDYNTTPYATNTIIRIGNSTGTIAQNELNILGASSDRFVNIPAITGVSESYVNGEGLYFSVKSGDPTAGDSDVTLYITYALIEL